MTTNTAQLRVFAQEHDNLPAFQAAFLACMFLSAMLFNAGVFALLTFSHMMLDLIKYHDVHGFSWGRSVRATLRESLMDGALLSLSLVFAVYLHDIATGSAMSGMVRAQTVVIRSLGMLLPEMGIFCRTMSVFSRVREHLARVGDAGRRKRLTKMQGVWLLMMIVNLALLAMAPQILHLDSAQWMRLLTSEVIPWKV